MFTFCLWTFDVQGAVQIDLFCSQIVYQVLIYGKLIFTFGFRLKMQNRKKTKGSWLWFELWFDFTFPNKCKYMSCGSIFCASNQQRCISLHLFNKWLKWNRFLFFIWLSLNVLLHMELICCYCLSELQKKCCAKHICTKSPDVGIPIIQCMFLERVWDYWKFLWVQHVLWEVLSQRLAVCQIKLYHHG